MEKRIKGVGYFLQGILIFGAMLEIPALFIVGAEWFSKRLLPWFMLASILAFIFIDVRSMKCVFYKVEKQVTGSSPVLSTILRSSGATDGTAIGSERVYTKVWGGGWLKGWIVRFTANLLDAKEPCKTVRHDNEAF